MDDFELAFKDVQLAAQETLGLAKAVVKQVKSFERAAREGNLVQMKRAQAALEEAVEDMRFGVAGALHAWPYEKDDEERHLAEHFRDELVAAATKKGVAIQELDDGRLFAYPSMVDILPRHRAVAINGRNVQAIRPSYLAELLLRYQRRGRRSRFRPEALLEALYTAYCHLVDGNDKNLPDDGVQSLAEIYRRLTILPGVARGYDRTEFARDLHFLDSSGPRKTKKGAVVSFPAATGARHSRSKPFIFHEPDGREVTYTGIRFRSGG